MQVNIWREEGESKFQPTSRRDGVISIMQQKPLESIKKLRQGLHPVAVLVSGETDENWPSV